MGSIPGQGTKILHAVQCSLKEEEEKETGDYFHALKKKFGSRRPQILTPQHWPELGLQNWYWGRGGGLLGPPLFSPLDQGEGLLLGFLSDD